MPYLPDTQTGDLCLSLATLLHSGMDLTYGASMLPKMKRPAEEAAGKIKKGCADGLPLSEAMDPEHFPPYVTGLVRMGEESGRLEESLYSLSDYYYKKHERSVRIRSALTYPIILAVLMLAVIGVLLVKILPVFDRVYASLGGSMAGLAGAFLQAGLFLEMALPVLCIVFAVALGGFVAVACMPKLKAAFLKAWNARFGDSGIARASNDARFAQALSMGLASGMPLDDAVRLASELNSGVPAAKARYDACLDMIAAGDPVTDALKASGALPEDACALLELGQSSGTTDSLMASIAGRLSEQANRAVEGLSAKIEPALVIASSLAAGAILVSVMLPLMDIMAAMR